MSRFRKHTSYSNVTATLALLLALSGTAYAALAANSVRSRHIAPNAAKGVDIKESSLGPVPYSNGVVHPSHGPIPGEQLFDAMGIGVVMGRIEGLGNNATDAYAKPVGLSTASVIEGNQVMGGIPFGTDIGNLKVQLLTGTMPASSSRRFTLRAGNTPTSLSDLVSCEIAAGQSQCVANGEVGIGTLQDMFSIEISTTGSPGSQTFVFGYSFTQQGTD